MQTGYDTSETGLGSLRRVQEYLYHPNEIKTLQMGNVVYMSKDTGYHGRVQIYKPY